MRDGIRTAQYEGEERPHLFKLTINKPSVEEVFIGDLLHDIGKLFLDQYFPDQYAITIKLAAAANISIWEAEKTALGVGHAPGQ